MDQITHWLLLPPDQKWRDMKRKLRMMVLNDMSHPAYRRFKEYYEPLGQGARPTVQGGAISCLPQL